MSNQHYHQRTACQSCHDRKVKCTHNQQPVMPWLPGQQSNPAGGITSTPGQGNASSTSSDYQFQGTSYRQPTTSGSALTSPRRDDADDEEPGWRISADEAVSQASKKVCVKFVKEKREKLAEAEKRLAESTPSGRGAAERAVEVSVSATKNSPSQLLTSLQEAKQILQENINDGIRNGVRMSEMQ